MATAEEVISKALALILVRQSESPLEPDEYNSGIESLNDLMTNWDGAGLALGYTIVTNLSDEITVPPAALRAIKQNLAIELAPEFGGNVDQLLMVNAANSLTQLRVQQVKPIPSRFPSTLPTGTGNQSSSGFNDDKFYGGHDSGILTEQDGSILLETNNQDFS